jgi:dipeptidyl aminopeptidase/acylaminoacyl peptidase
MRRLFTLAAAVSLLSTPAAQSRRAMTIDDLITSVRVADPQVSPNGSRVVFTRTTTALDTGRRNADIWMVPADGSAPARALITGERSENTARFTPDGQGLVFLSTRDGAMQLYVASVDGTGARRLTTLAAGVQPPVVVSPDGSKVAFVSDVYPECRDEACNKAASEAAEKDPVKMRVLSSLPYRHWDEWRLRIRHHVFITDIDSGETRDITPGDFDSPPHFYEDGAIAFSADSQTVAFVSNRDGRDREMVSTNQDVWLVPVAGPSTALGAGGEPKKVGNNPAADVQPTFSPDGKLLAVRAQRRAGFEADRWYLDLYDRATGSKRTLFDTPDLSVEDFSFSPDGRLIYFTAIEKGTVNAYSSPVAGGTPTLVVKGGTVGDVRVGKSAIVFTKSTWTQPADVYIASTVSTASTVPMPPKALTDENALWLSQVAAPKVESLTVAGAGGTPVQYWLMKPPNFDPARKYPTVFLIHGGPQSAWKDGWSSRWNLALWAAQGYVIAAPNPRGSLGFGQKFVDEISQDWCGKVMADIDAVVNTVTKLPYVDTQRLGVAGASYGGYAVNWMISHADRYKAAVSHDGVFNLETMSLASEELWFTDWESGGPPWSAPARKHFARCSPHLFADKIKTPTLVITNEQDFRVPVDQGLQMFTALRRTGVPSRAIMFPDEGHWVLGALNSKRWHDEVFGWLKKYLLAP